MTREEIIAMAREAGNGETRDLTEWLEEFAALIEQRAAAAEREACAVVAERFGWSGECRHVAAEIRARGEHVPSP